MSSKISNTSVIESPINLPIQSGGFNGKTDLEALSNIKALHRSQIGVFTKAANLLSNSKIPDNIVPGASKIIAPTIKGPGSVSIGSTATYKITNFNSFTSYSIQSTVGTVSISGDTITYTAPNVVGDGGFEINGRKINISVISNATFTAIDISNITNGVRIDQRSPLVINSSGGIPNISDTFLGIEVYIAKAVTPNIPLQVKFHSKTENNFTINGNSYSLLEDISTLINETDFIIKVRSKYQLSSYSSFSTVKSFKSRLNTIVNTPVIESPLNNSSNFTISKDTVYTGSLFSNAVNVSQFLTSDWQIATDINFQNIFYNIIDNTDIDSLTGKPILLGPKLSYGNSYYVRTRYKDNEGNYSQWSPIVKITTGTSPIISTPVLTGDTVNSNSTTVNPYTLSATSSLYSINDSVGGTHEFTEWMTSSDVTFTTYETTNWITPDIKLDVPVYRNSKVYVMVRYQSTKGIVSAWSNVATLSNNYTP